MKYLTHQQAMNRSSLGRGLQVSQGYLWRQGRLSGGFFFFFNFFLLCVPILFELFR